MNYRGKYLQAARKARGMTGRRLSELTGVAQSSVTRWEAGGRIEEENSQRIIEVLGLDPLEWSQLYANPNAPIFWVEEQGDDAVVVAIRDDDRLLPEAREHLIRQYQLLLRVSPAPSTAAPARRAGDA